MSDLVRDKQLELSRILEKWALDENILGPGDELIFALEVRRKSIVVMEPALVNKSATVGEVSVGEFFALERFVAAGFNKYVGGRAYHAILHLGGRGKEEEAKTRQLTVRQLLLWPEFKQAFLDGEWPNVGPAISEAVIKLLLDAGFVV